MKYSPRAVSGRLDDNSLGFRISIANRIVGKQRNRGVELGDPTLQLLSFHYVIFFLIVTAELII